MSRFAGTIIAAVLLAIGIAVGGWLVGTGFHAARLADRFVTVKGLAERDVEADLVIWPIGFVATGNDLAGVQAKIAQDAEIIRGFLEEAGIAAEAVEVSAVQVQDLLAQAYRSGPVESRYIIQETMLVRTTDIDAVVDAHAASSALIAQGVVLGGEGGSSSGPSFVFTGLNEVKPEMIAEATANAREAAAQFAADSGSALGGIRRASQGLFQILPRDDVPGLFEPQQRNKRVRVVSTIEYFLRD
ncbi:MAG: SIMPL domain-containing protein [Pseudomonadota bacterium]